MLTDVKIQQGICRKCRMSQFTVLWRWLTMSLFGVMNKSHSSLSKKCLWDSRWLLLKIPRRAPSLLCETDSEMSLFILFFVCAKIRRTSDTSKLLQCNFHLLCDRFLWAVCVLSQKLGSVATSRGRKWWFPCVTWKYALSLHQKQEQSVVHPNKG